MTFRSTASALYQRLFAQLYDPITWAVERWMFEPHRRYLVQDLDGRILDLGCGTGAMFPYYNEVLSLEVRAVDPDPFMLRKASRRASALNLTVDLTEADGQSLPYQDASFDAVISSLVLCTVPDVDATLDELARVLRPGGELRVFEHVKAEGWRGAVQQGLEPLWHEVARGCHLRRDTERRLSHHSNFEVEELTHLPIGITPVRPFIRGKLRRR